MASLSDLSWFKAKTFIENCVFSGSAKKLSEIIDHIELRAICHQDKIVSTDDYLNIRSDESAFNGTEDANEADDWTTYPNYTSGQEMVTFIQHRFKYREQQWGKIWPFHLQISQRGHCNITFNPQHQYAQLYTYILLTLYAKYINSANEYRNHFESLCYNVAKSIFPESNGWIVKQSGAAASGLSAYAGNKLEKLSAISKDLLLANQGIKRRLTTSGDGGIDLIAFHKLYDSRGNLPVIFMQCACSSDINELEHKTHDVSFSQLNNILHLEIAHEWFLFSPYDWYDHLQPNRFIGNNNQAVIFDRTRILKSISELKIIPILSETIKHQINEFMTAEESFI